MRKRVYRVIDKRSALLVPLRNLFDLQNPEVSTRARRCKRAGGSSAGGTGATGDTAITQAAAVLDYDSNPQYGYGEITGGAFQNLLTVFQNAGILVQKDTNLASIARHLPFPIEEYSMTADNKSTFLDIGSGFGKPVFHCAMQTGCRSYGVEIEEVRRGFSVA